jgi:hypothetical protein
VIHVGNNGDIANTRIQTKTPQDCKLGA